MGRRRAMMCAMRMAFVVIVALAVPSVRAQNTEVKRYLNAAITLYENLEYEKALKQLKKAKPKAAGPDDETRIALLEGCVLADMGKENDALTAFKTGFGLNLDAKLPVDVSPKVQAIVEKARSNVRKMLAPRLEAERVEAERLKVEEQAKAEAEQRRQEEEERTRLQPPPAVAKAGGGVRSVSWVPLAVGVASAGVATGLLIDANGKYQALLGGTAPADQAVAMRDSGKLEATLGYVFIGVAGAGVVSAALMFFLGRPGPQVTVVPTPGGAYASVSFSLDLGGTR
jgi:hypothetical protein